MLWGLAARWITFGAILTAIGAPVFHLLVVRRAGVGNGASFAASRTAGWVGAIAAVVILPAAVVRLWIQTAQMRFPDDPWMDVAKRMVMETSWGTAWMSQVALCLVLIVAFLAARRGGAALWATVGALSLALAATVSMSSHAQSAQRFAGIAGFVDWAHIAGAGAWLGTLGVLFASVVRDDGSPEGRPGYLVALLSVFSPVALVAAALVAGSGLVSSLAHVDSVAALVTSRYGRALLWKLLAVFVVLVLGWRNWKFGTPAIEKSGTTAVKRGMAAELVAAAVVLLLTAALVVTPPPMEEAAGG